MRFIKSQANTTPLIDAVFKVTKQAKDAIAKHGNAAVTNATIGVLLDENQQLVAFNSVFDNYNKLNNRQKAAYATGILGNDNFRKQTFHWVTEGINLDLHHSAVATSGGAGALATTISNMLDPNEILILPEIGWGPYTLMASDNNLQYRTYKMFENDAFNINSFKQVCLEVLATQKKLLVVINDPCHNPTGYSLTKEEWQEIIDFMNECSKEAPCIILNDIAYIDFGYNSDETRKYMETFNTISDNVVIISAFSISKSLTSYGLRCGAALILAKNPQTVRDIEVVFEKCARARWSNVNNSAMENFVQVTTQHREALEKEKAQYVALLKQRSDIFLSEAKACGLICYPYKEGFFVTIAVEDDQLLETYYQALQDNLIFTIKVQKGIRVAVCSLNIEKCKGLAQRMKNILDALK